jgi:transcriptional regulator with XRE-family HTH domain
MFITVEQIKAARALLKWTQKDLAHHAGLKDDQIQAFEAGRTRSLDVLESVYKTLTLQGLEFYNGGVIPNKVASYTLNSYMDVLNDICMSLPDGGEVLKHCVDDRRSTPEVMEKVRKMRESGIRERLTISDQNHIVSGNREDYRQIPADYFSSSEVIITYLNKVVFFVDGKALVVLNQTLANIFRDQFEYWWKAGKALDGA